MDRCVVGCVVGIYMVLYTISYIYFYLDRVRDLDHVSCIMYWLSVGDETTWAGSAGPL
jgi:hypothetical protein